METEKWHVWVFVAALVALPWFLLWDYPMKEPEPIFVEEVNGLTIKVFNSRLTEDEDDGKIIVKIPIKLTNDSDHAFVFSIPNFTYNETESVSALFALNEGEVDGKIKRGETKKDYVTIKLDTRDKSEVKSVHPTFLVYDLKTEEATEIKPDISLETTSPAE
jgi:hypothetical protein